jgi:hypothetical protein
MPEPGKGDPASRLDSPALEDRAMRLPARRAWISGVSRGIQRFMMPRILSQYPCRSRWSSAMR